MAKQYSFQGSLKDTHSSLNSPQDVGLEWNEPGSKQTIALKKATFSIIETSTSAHDRETGIWFLFLPWTNTKLDKICETKVFRHCTQCRTIILETRNKQGEPNKFPCSLSGQSFQVTAQGRETETETSGLAVLRRQCSEFREDKAKKRGLQRGRASDICRRVSLNLWPSTHMHTCEKKIPRLWKKHWKKSFWKSFFQRRSFCYYQPGWKNVLIHGASGSVLRRVLAFGGKKNHRKIQSITRMKKTVNRNRTRNDNGTSR